MSSDKPIRLSFTHDGEPISEESVFERLYDGLEELISDNLSAFKTRRRHWYGPIIGSQRHGAEAQRREALYFSWRMNTPTITAHVESPNGTQTLDVFARENFDMGAIKKRPNITILRGPRQQDLLVMREARTYALDFIKNYMVRAHRAASRSFDAQATTELIEGTRQVAPEGFAYIPEPLFLNGIEALCERDGYPRITPYFMEIRTSDESESLKSWHIREWLALIRDTRLEPDSFGQFLARTHHLGIAEFLDRQLDHYAIAQDTKTIVNYDPDFLLITNRASRINHIELDDIRSMLRASGRESMYRAVKRARSEELERLRSEQPEAQQRMLEYAHRS
jgi:hypothetical protein